MFKGTEVLQISTEPRAVARKCVAGDRSPLSGCALPGGGAATLTAAWQGLDPFPIIVPSFLINPYVNPNKHYIIMTY